MALGSLRSRQTSSPNDNKEATGYNEYDVDHQDQVRGIETSAETSLHRGLKARHISMIAIGGAIGTGCMWFVSFILSSNFFVVVVVVASPTLLSLPVLLSHSTRAMQRR